MCVNALSHSKWVCKYHLGVCAQEAKSRRKAIFGNIRRPLGPMFRALVQHKRMSDCRKHLMPDQVHICITISLKHPVAPVIGVLKGSAIALACMCGKERNF